MESPIGTPIETPTPQNKSTGTISLIGLGLVLFGALTILSRFVPAVGQMLWAATFAGGGFATYRAYLKDKAQRWWMLLPAYGLSSLSGLLVVDLIQRVQPFGMDNLAMLVPAYLFGAIAFPFWWLYKEQKLPMPLALIGAPFALLALAFLLGAIGPAIPILLIIAGLVIIARQRTQNQNQTASAPVGIVASRPSEPVKLPEPAFTPLNIPINTTQQQPIQPIRGPQADK